MTKHIKITFPFLLSAILITAISYLRFYFVGHIGLEQGKPDPFESNILFGLFFTAILFCFYAYYQAVYNAEKLDFSDTNIKYLSYLLIFISIFSLPLLSSDVFIYMVCGDAANLKGINPYTDYKQFHLLDFYQYVSPTWKGKAINVYGPVNLFFMQISAFIGSGSIWLSIFIYKIILAVAAFIFIQFTSMLIQLKKPNYAKEILAFIALSPILWLQNTGQIHNDMFVALFIIIGLYFFEKEKYFISIIFYTLAIHSKLYAILLLPIFILYIVLKFRFSFSTLKITSLSMLIFSALTVLVYLAYWNGIETLLVYTKEFKALPLNNPGHILGLVITNLFDFQLNPETIYSITKYIFAIPAAILGLYLLIKIKDNIESYNYFIFKGLILLFCFYIARFHQWYFIITLPFFITDIRKSWLLWGVLVFTLTSFFDIHNFMDKKAMTIYFIPVAVLTVNVLFFWKIKDRFLNKAGESK